MKKQILFAAIIAASCNQPQTAKEPSEPQAEATPAPSNWVYTSEKNEMDGKVTSFAMCVGIDTLDLGFPYKEAIFQITIRQADGKPELLLQCNSCQFLTSLMEEKKYRVKFDDEEPYSVGVLGASAGVPNLVFFKNGDKLIEKLRTAKALMVEPEFFQIGTKAIKFQVEGLQWPQK